MSRFIWEPGEIHFEGDYDACPGTWDPPGHSKLKTEKLCGYCKLKERLQEIKDEQRRRTK